MHEIIVSFKESLERLDEVLAEKYSTIVRDASIQRFEFTVELAWKSIQKFLRQHGVSCNSPKNCLRESFKFGLIEDDPLWVKMIEDRNLTVHTYNEETADKIYKSIPSYASLLRGLFEAIESNL